MNRNRRAGFKYGDVENWVRSDLSGPRTKVLLGFCGCIIKMLELARRHPGLIARFDGTPLHLDELLTRFTLFDHSFVLEYSAKEHVYVLNFAPEGRRPGGKRRARPAAALELKRVHKAATKAIRRRRRPRADLLRSCREGMGAIWSNLYDSAAVVQLRLAADAIARFARRLPRLRLRYFDNSLTGAPQRVCTTWSPEWRLAPQVILVGGAMPVLFHGCEAGLRPPVTLWEPTLFGELLDGK